MLSKNYEDITRRLSNENAELRECLKHLQKELFDIVDLKTEIYIKRYKAEFGGSSSEIENEEGLRHEIERIREEVFNLPFEESSRELIRKF